MTITGQMMSTPVVNGPGVVYLFVGVPRKSLARPIDFVLMRFCSFSQPPTQRYRDELLSGLLFGWRHF